MIMLSKIKNEKRPIERKHDIIVGALNNDAEEVEAALAEDPTCIEARHSNTGVTALHIAALRGNYWMVEKLLRAPGLDLDTKDSRGMDVMDAAHRGGHPKIIELISRVIYPDNYEEVQDTNVARIPPPKPE